MPWTQDSFSCRALECDAAGQDLAGIMAAALRAVDPRARVLEQVRVVGDAIQIGDDTIPLPPGRILVLGGGKAAAAMTDALVERLGTRVHGGLVAVKTKPTALDSIGPVDVVEAAHPTPDARSVEAAKRLLAMAAEATSQDLVLCPISGGASSLLCAPAAGVELAQVQEVTEALLGVGTDIHEMNAVRKHLDAMKGGGLARAAAPARVVGLILSDVVGDDDDAALASVASGPTMADPTNFRDAQAVLQRLANVPTTIVDRITLGVAGAIDETPKPGTTAMQHVRNRCVGSNASARRAAAQAARAAGYDVVELPTLRGEARTAGIELGAKLASQPPGVVAIGGGETTVTLRGTGRGGRNQELALAAVPVMLGLHDAILATLGTDGEDGPTDAAGAVVRGNTLPRALELGLDPLAHLDNNDAYRFFDPLGDLLRCGPTGTNVCDLVFTLTEKR